MTGTWTRIRRQRVLYLFILPGLVLIFLFNYLPMYGVVIAFKNFNPLLGIWGSKWVGLDNFARLVDSLFFWRIFRNTLTINLMHLLIGFPAPIVLALLLNEVRIAGLKRSVQTITYLRTSCRGWSPAASWSRCCPRTAASSPWCRSG